MLCPPLHCRWAFSTCLARNKSLPCMLCIKPILLPVPLCQHQGKWRCFGFQKLDHFSIQPWISCCSLLRLLPISCEKEKPSRKLDSKKSYPDLLWVLFKGNKSFLDTDGYCNGYIFTDKRRLMDLGKKTFRCLRKLGQVLHIRTHHHHLFEFLMFYVYFTSHASRAQQQQQRSFPLPGMLRWRWENSRKHFVFRHKDISWQPAPL